MESDDVGVGFPDDQLNAFLSPEPERGDVEQRDAVTRQLDIRDVHGFRVTGFLVLRDDEVVRLSVQPLTQIRYDGREPILEVHLCLGFGSVGGADEDGQKQRQGQQEGAGPQERPGMRERHSRGHLAIRPSVAVSGGLPDGGVLSDRWALWIHGSVSGVECPAMAGLPVRGGCPRSTGGV
ncbi:hypothetical protein ACFVXH_19710 [Kitasatospora sp. NPDC058184]|uniref:hypothetical protein n=1 Tax=Kitasatospora sp. NPDC058184 TaxID=3346370 RepID=UPI0036D7DFD0